MYSPYERVLYGMSKTLSILLPLALLAACALPHVPPKPRSAFAERFTVVRVDVSCSEASPFNQIDWPDHIGNDPDIEWMAPHTVTGVIISERHVLTAAHTVRCPVSPAIKVTLADGRRFNMAVERDDAMFGDGEDIARLEITSAATFGIGIPPPELVPYKDDNAIWCAQLWRGSSCGEHGRMNRFDAPTRDGDSGAPVYEELGGSSVYDERGGLIGLVVEGPRPTNVVRVSARWLEGT